MELGRLLSPLITDARFAMADDELLICVPAGLGSTPGLGLVAGFGLRPGFGLAAGFGLSNGAGFEAVVMGLGGGAVWKTEASDARAGFLAETDGLGSS